MRITGIVVLVLALTGSDRVSCEAARQAQNGAATVRGSWVTEGTGARYMYLFAVQDDRISGVVCTRCFDLDNLAFVSDGRVAHVDAAGEPTANLLTSYLSQGRLTGTYIGNTRPDRRNNFVWMRQHDPDAPKDSVWRGAFDAQP